VIVVHRLGSAAGYLAALFLAFAPTMAAAQAPPITPDRPGIGSGATVLAPGLVHLETGASLSTTDGIDQYAIGEVLVRAGVRGVEVQLFGNSFVVQRGETPSALDEEGFQDAGVGLKVPLLRGAGDRLSLSLQGLLTAPTGADLFTADEWIGALNALADVSLGDRVGLSVNLGIEEGVGALDESYSVIVTPGIALGNGFGVYGGWAGFFTDAGDVDYGEAGLTYVPSDHVQVDVNGGWALDGDEWFVGAGLAMRWGAW
jgi:hypothetical protein